MRILLMAALGLALLTGCGGPAGPLQKPATHDEALKVMKAVDGLDQHFPKDLEYGQWCRFNAKFVGKQGDEGVFRGFLDNYDFCLVRTSETLAGLGKVPRVVIVARYAGFAMPTAEEAKKAGGDEGGGSLPRRKFTDAWIWVEPK